MSARKTTWILLCVAAVGLVFWWSTWTGDPDPAQPSNAHAAAPRPAAWGKPDREVWAQPKATIRGVVRDVEGAPIAGATVCARTQAAEVPTVLQRQPACTASGPQGVYALQDLFAVSYTVFASAPQYRPTRYHDADAPPSRRQTIRLAAGQTREGVDITLASGGVPVRGVVKDLAGGPIAGAWVRVDEGTGWFDHEGSASTVTDDEGAFETWTSPGRVRVTATAEGYTQSSKAGVAPGQTLELFLTPASTLVGKVVLADSGEPVAGARVSAEIHGMFTRSAGQTHSEDDGRFRIEGLEPGSYKLSATTPELYGLSAEAVHLGLAETSEPRLVQVHPAFAVEARVVVEGTQGNPCPSGSVQLKDANTDLETSESLEPDGSVTLRALQPGAYRVYVECMGYVSAEDYPEVTITDASISELVYEVQTGLAIRGEVVHADGKPVEGVQVMARPVLHGEDPRAQQTNAWGPASDAAGTFEVRGLLAGTYEVDAFSFELRSSKDPVRVALEPGKDADGVRIELPATGIVIGTVHDARGNPMDGAVIHANSDAGGRAQTHATDDGSFRLENVLPGPATVQAQAAFMGERMRAPGKSDDDARGERVIVEAGQEVEVEIVVEAHDGTIRGKVVDAEGGPLPDAFVDIQRETDSAAARAGVARRAMSWGSWWRDPVLADTEGRFEISELADGRYTLRAFREGGGEGVLEGVEVGSDVTLELGSPGALEGTIVARGGSPPERFTIKIRDDRTGHSAHDEFYRTAGVWRLTDVPEGKYAIEVKSPAGTGSAEVDLGSGETKSGIEIGLAGTVTLRGTLVDLETGAPVPGMKVTSSTRKGGFSFDMTTTKAKKEIADAQGRFELERVPVGRGRIVVTAFGLADSDYAFMSAIPIDIPEGASVHQLEPVGLLKQRTKHRERPGSLGLRTREAAPDEDEEDRRHVVAVVRPGGPAAKAGIEIGDEIIAVDGHDVRGVHAHRYRALVQAPPGHQLTLTLADDRQVSIALGPPE